MIACGLLPPPAAVLLPPRRGKGVRSQGKHGEGTARRGNRKDMLVGMEDVTPTKTRGMAVRTF